MPDPAPSSPLSAPRTALLLRMQGWLLLSPEEVASLPIVEDYSVPLVEEEESSILAEQGWLVIAPEQMEEYGTLLHSLLESGVER